jgi:NitT/TauT family transport system ATP-binding protein
VTHDLREAVYLADRILVMSARPGRIIAERTVPFERPRGREQAFSPAFTALVQELRDLIDLARQAAPGGAEHVS